MSVAVHSGDRGALDQACDDELRQLCPGHRRYCRPGGRAAGKSLGHGTEMYLMLETSPARKHKSLRVYKPGAPQHF